MSNSSVITLTLNNQEYTVDRATLRLWLQLEDQKDKIKQAAESGHSEGLSSSICAYISAVLNIDVSDFPWYEVIEAFYKLNRLNSPSFDFPFLKSAIEEQKVAWDYDGRTWYIWLHLLSSKGWNVEYIAGMNVDDAIGIAQEIAVEKQLDLELQWALSEKSVEYDRSGKGKFKELPRPGWMSKLPREIQITKIPKHMMPQGMILTWEKDGTSKPN